MSPITALFVKEFRQHWFLAAAAVVTCLLLQAAYCWLNWQYGNPYYEFQFFVAFALYITVFYAGIAAAVSYSTEHANKTFIFLRKLPISHTMLAAGKIGWALCGTGLVLIANLLLCVFWFLFLKDAAGFNVPDFNSEEFLQVSAWFITIITKVFFWGLLWTTICRSQMNAVVATGASIMGIYGGFMYLYYILDTEFGIVIPTDETSVMAYHWIEIVLVASLALWRVFRWFDFEAKESRAAKLLTHKVVLFRYPQQVQSPFAALVHHHLRHAGTGYLFGIFSFALFSLGFLFMFAYLSDNVVRNEYTATWWWLLGAVTSVVGIFVLWGTIFGHDLKNDSYLFLSRMGVHEGAFWWSRILPALILYIPVLVCVTIAYLVDMGVHQNNLDMEHFWTEFAPMWFIGWLALPAMGAFMSISYRSQIVAFVLTGGGVWLLCVWMIFFASAFGFSPLWTTLPICIALFAASRLRARYWFKETFTWSSRFVPLAPVLATVLAILIAVPFVRVFSVPSVSWSQIEVYFEQADFGDMIRAPEKRQALLRHIAQHGTVPPEYEHYLGIMGQNAADWELNAFSGITAEEFLLLEYERRRTQLNDYFSGELLRRNPDYPVPTIFRIFLLMFWEPVREERVLRLQIAAALGELGGIQDKRAESFRDLVERFDRQSMVHMYYGMGLMSRAEPRKGIIERYAHMMSARQLWRTFTAINQWYAEHKTLPESLDVLVEAGFLSAFPEHPFTGELMEYHRDAPAPEDIDSVGISVHIVGVVQEWWRQGVRRDPHESLRAAAMQSFRESGGTYLRLDGLVYVIVRYSEGNFVAGARTPTCKSQEETDDIL